MQAVSRNMANVVCTVDLYPLHTELLPKFPTYVYGLIALRHRSAGEMPESWRTCSSQLLLGLHFHEWIRLCRRSSSTSSRDGTNKHFCRPLLWLWRCHEASFTLHCHYMS